MLKASRDGDGYRWDCALCLPTHHKLRRQILNGILFTRQDIESTDGVSILATLRRSARDTALFLTNEVMEGRWQEKLETEKLVDSSRKRFAAAQMYDNNGHCVFPGIQPPMIPLFTSFYSSSTLCTRTTTWMGVIC